MHVVGVGRGFCFLIEQLARDYELGGRIGDTRVRFKSAFDETFRQYVQEETADKFLWGTVTVLPFLVAKQTP